MLHSLLSIVCSKEHTPTHPHSRCTQANSLEDVGSPSNPTINIDLHAVEDLRTPLMEFQQGDDGRRTGVQVASAVVAEQNPI